MKKFTEVPNNNSNSVIVTFKTYKNLIKQINYWSKNCTKKSASYDNANLY